MRCDSEAPWRSIDKAQVRTLLERPADNQEAAMPTDPKRGQQPGSPGRRPSVPAGLPRAAVDETGNEDPGAELTELPPCEAPTPAGPGGPAPVRARRGRRAATR